VILPPICRAAQDSSAANAKAAPPLAFATFGQGRSFDHPKPNSRAVLWLRAPSAILARHEHSALAPRQESGDQAVGSLTDGTAAAHGDEFH
jgi:hypothetical protein